MLDNDNLSTSYVNTIYNVGWVKSFVDDLKRTGYCKHESSLVLRSAEVQPLFWRFVRGEDMLDPPVLPTFDLAVSPPPMFYKSTLPPLTTKPKPNQTPHHCLWGIVIQKLWIFLHNITLRWKRKRRRHWKTSLSQDKGCPLLLYLQLQQHVGVGDGQGWAFFMPMRFSPGLFKPYHNILNNIHPIFTLCLFGSSVYAILDHNEWTKNES